MKALRTNLFLVALGLSLLGLVMVYSATYRDFGAHYLIVRLGHIAAALAAFVAASRVPYTAWRGLAPWVYGAVLVSLVLVLIPGIGVEVGGSRRWFDLGVFSLQPAEFAKIAAVIMLSVAVARRRLGEAPGEASSIPFGALAAVGVLAVLVVLEPDFGTSVMILAGAAGVLWASEVRTGALLLLGSAASAGLVGVMLLEPYRRERFTTFLDPWSSPEGEGYQVVQSMIAIKSGSVFGLGVGSGHSEALVPEIMTDMISALIGEELGLLGMVVVICAFCFVGMAGFGIAMQTPSVMGRCMAAGLTTILAVQAILNIGATMGLFPLAGMTLPFVSYGGSSLIACFAAIGILYRISEDSERAREVEPEKAPEKDAPGADRRRRDRGARDSGAVRGG